VDRARERAGEKTMKPCPGCKNHDVFLDHIPASELYYVNCSPVRSGCGVNGAWGDRESAIEKWNKLPR
jgi:hypothetical protein